jgi:hypothetical protein
MKQAPSFPSFEKNRIQSFSVHSYSDSCIDPSFMHSDAALGMPMPDWRSMDSAWNIDAINVV